MLGRWAMPGLVVCILLGAGTLLLWIRSYYFYDAIGYQNGWQIQCVSYESILTLVVQNRTLYQTSSGWRWATQTANAIGPLHRGGARMLMDFAWRRQGFVWGGKPISLTTITVPTWTPSALCGVIGSFCYLSRGKVRWEWRKDVRWINPRLRTRIKRFAIFSAAGAGIGAGMAGLDLAFDLYRVEWEEILSGLIPLPLVCLLIVMTRRRIPWRKALLWMFLEIAGCVCFFAATAEQIWHYWGAYDYERPDIFGVALVFGLAGFVFGAILLLFLQVKSEPVKPGPYCPECGYCLIGAPTRICPECGRGFNLEELGVGVEALLPGADTASKLAGYTGTR